jgi:hypothetical protein
MLSSETNHNIGFGRDDQDDIEYQLITLDIEKKLQHEAKPFVFYRRK